MAQLGDRHGLGAGGERRVDGRAHLGEAVGAAFDELLEVARRRRHDLVEEERRLRHHHREPRGRLAFDSEVRESHRSRLSGRATPDLCMAYNEPLQI